MVVAKNSGADDPAVVTARGAAAGQSGTRSRAPVAVAASCSGGATVDRLLASSARISSSSSSPPCLSSAAHPSVTRVCRPVRTALDLDDRQARVTNPCHGTPAYCAREQPLSYSPPTPRTRRRPPSPWPVTKLAASDARNTAAPTSSSGRPKRFIGVRVISSLPRSVPVSSDALSSVGKTPGIARYGDLVHRPLDAQRLRERQDRRLGGVVRADVAETRRTPPASRG